MGDLVESLDSDLSIFSEGASREKILALEQKILEEGGTTDTESIAPLKHHFAPGLYAREIFMPAGTVIVGKIHKHSHVNTISQGRVLVTTEFGGCEYVAPITFVSKAGTKRAVYILEDCIWTTYHPTNKTDLKEIEDEVIAKTFDELDLFLEHKG